MHEKKDGRVMPPGRNKLSARSPADQAAVDYLLGNLAEPDQAELERRLLEDGQSFEQLSIAEDELIEEYLQGELSETERERFEGGYLASPALRERLDFARALKANLLLRESAQKLRDRAGRSFPGGRGTALRVSLAFALVLVVAGSFISFQYVQTRRELDRGVAEKADLLRRETELRKQVADLKARAESLMQEADPARNPASKPKPISDHSESVVAAFALTATLVRDSGVTQTLNLSREVTEVALTLSTREGLPGPFRATLRTVTGSTVWRTRDSSPLLAEKPPGSVTVRIPASRLPNNDYILTLSRVGPGGRAQDAADYYFRVKKT
jgi:Flp pilus assembly protein TadG